MRQCVPVCAVPAAPILSRSEWLCCAKNAERALDLLKTILRPSCTVVHLQRHPSPSSDVQLVHPLPYNNSDALLERTLVLMRFEGWLEENGNSISRCVHGHSETLDGLEAGDYVLRTALAIEYELPLYEVWFLDSRYRWEDATDQIVEDFRKMGFPPPPRQETYKREDRAALCIWEFGNRGSDESAQVVFSYPLFFRLLSLVHWQDIFERAKRFRQVLFKRLNTSELIDSALTLQM